MTMVMMDGAAPHRHQDAASSSSSRRATRSTAPLVKEQQLLGREEQQTEGCSMYGGKKKKTGEEEQGERTALQLAFPQEDLRPISPEWQLEWCSRDVEALVEEGLLKHGGEGGSSRCQGVTDAQWEELRQEVIRVAASHRADDSGVKVERIAGKHDRRFVYCPAVSSFCYRHGLITHGPWVPFVKKALGIDEEGEEVTWQDHCMGIYALLSQAGADVLPWHTDFCALEVDEVAKEGQQLQRRHYLHQLVNVLVPMQRLDAATGFTVFLTREGGRTPLYTSSTVQAGQWYALDPGYPHAADGNNGSSDRVVLNISYVRPSFPVRLRRHVITHLQYWRNHITASQLLTLAKKKKKKQQPPALLQQQHRSEDGSHSEEEGGRKRKKGKTTASKKAEGDGRAWGRKRGW